MVWSFHCRYGISVSSSARRITCTHSKISDTEVHKLHAQSSLQSNGLRYRQG